MGGVCLGRRSADAAAEIRADVVAPHSVALVGGPCGGKTSVIPVLRAQLTRLGFHVITVSEVATQLFADVGGYDPRWEGTARHVSLQVILLQMQISNEIACRGIAALRPEPCILLHDRAAQDGATFCSVEEWGRVLTEANTTDARLSARYDLIVHLESTASETAGKIYQYGDCGNNPVRFHNRQQAELADRRSQKNLANLHHSSRRTQKYGCHPRYRFVSNKIAFGDKVAEVVDVVSRHMQRHSNCNALSHPTDSPLGGEAAAGDGAAAEGFDEVAVAVG